jgi:hypothetical protein
LSLDPRDAGGVLMHADFDVSIICTAASCVCATSPPPNLESSVGIRIEHC